MERPIGNRDNTIRIVTSSEANNLAKVKQLIQYAYVHMYEHMTLSQIANLLQLPEENLFKIVWPNRVKIHPDIRAAIKASKAPLIGTFTLRKLPLDAQIKYLHDPIIQDPTRLTASIAAEVIALRQTK